MYTLFTHYNEDNMFSSLTAEDHSRRRRNLASSYSATHVLNQESRKGDIWATVGRYIENIEREGHRCAVSDGYAIDIYPLNTYYASDNITAHLFGKDLATKALGSIEDGPEVQHHRDFIDDCYTPSRRARVSGILHLADLHGHLYTHGYMWLIRIGLSMDGFQSRIEKSRSRGGYIPNSSTNNPKRSRSRLPIYWKFSDSSLCIHEYSSSYEPITTEWRFFGG